METFWENIDDEFLPEDFLPTVNPSRTTTRTTFDSTELSPRSVHLVICQCHFLMHSEVEDFSSDGRGGVVEVVCQFDLHVLNLHPSKPESIRNFTRQYEFN